MASTRNKPKASEPSKTATRPYIVLEELDGNVYRPLGVGVGAKGTGAIKAVAKNPDGTFAGGEYRAVPIGTWDSDGNILGITAEQRLVTSFRAGKAKAESNGKGVVE